jgi:hypothetical protein
MTTMIAMGGTTTAATVAGMTTAGLGVADGTGPLLQHVAGMTATAAPVTGATALGGTAATGTTAATAAKSALAAKSLAVAATAGGVALFGLLAVAAAGVGYLAYRAFSASGPPEPEEDSPATL